MLAALALATALTLATQSTRSAESRTTDYTTTDGALTLAIPEGWTVEDDGIGGELATIEPAVPGAHGIVTIQTSATLASPQSAVDAIAARVRGLGHEIRRLGPSVLGGRAACEISFDDHSAGMRCRMVIAAFHAKHYQFASVAAIEGADAIDSALDALLRSVRWLEPDRSYASHRGDLVIDVPSDWSVIDSYRDDERFFLVGPADQGFAASIAASVHPAQGRPFAQVVDTELNAPGKSRELATMEHGPDHLVIFRRLDCAPAAIRERTAGSHAAIEAYYRFDRETLWLHEPPVDPQDPFSAAALDVDFERRDVRIARVFVPIGGEVWEFSLVAPRETFDVVRADLEAVLRTLRTGSEVRPTAPTTAQRPSPPRGARWGKFGAGSWAELTSVDRDTGPEGGHTKFTLRSVDATHATLALDIDAGDEHVSHELRMPLDEAPSSATYEYDTTVEFQGRLLPCHVLVYEEQGVINWDCADVPGLTFMVRSARTLTRLIDFEARAR